MSAPLRNDTFLRALRRQPTGYTPVWLMRQAGRYLPEYRATRARAGSFMALAQSPALATEVTLQPLERFPLDAAILFSDILTIPDAMGLGLRFAEGEGPRFEHPVRDEAAIRALVAPDPGEGLRYVTDAVREIVRALDGRVPLIGFSGSPFTLACYMVEGQGSDDFRLWKRMLYARPDLARALLAVNTRAVTDYLLAQAEAGAQALMIFDTWGGMLSTPHYAAFSLDPMREVIDGVRAGLAARSGQAQVPIIVFTKGGGGWLEAMADCGAARAQVGDRVALQGNLDPMVLLTDPETVAREAARVVHDYGRGHGHVFNLGHGIVPATPAECVAALVETVHQTSRALHAPG
jgi:uroporphyrinogen decarboxylase